MRELKCKLINNMLNKFWIIISDDEIIYIDKKVYTYPISRKRINRDVSNCGMMKSRSS